MCSDIVQQGTQDYDPCEKGNQWNAPNNYANSAWRHFPSWKTGVGGVQTACLVLVHLSDIGGSELPRSFEAEQWRRGHCIKAELSLQREPIKSLGDHRSIQAKNRKMRGLGKN